jgi:hypothetical protein
MAGITADIRLTSIGGIIRGIGGIIGGIGGIRIGSTLGRGALAELRSITVGTIMAGCIAARRCTRRTATADVRGLRDATLTLDGLMVGGYIEEARAWRSWLLNAAAGTSSGCCPRSSSRAPAG